MLPFCQQKSSWYQYLHVKVQFLSIVYTKYQNVLEKKLEGVEFLIQALSKQDVESKMAVTLTYGKRF